MRGSMTSFCTVAGSLAIAGAIALAPVFAKDPVKIEVRSANKGVAVHAQAQGESAVLPECLEKLKLSAEQETEIKGIIQHFDGALGKVWTQFGDRYMHMIRLESSMLAAIEDNLSEPQREQVRERRRKTAHQEKVNASTPDKVNQATTKPANAVEDAADGVGVSLTAEQEAAADKLQEKYHPQLHSLHRDIQGLHARLLSLEADKLVEIEKVLTKEQITQLRAHRQDAPAGRKLAVTEAEPKKTE